jgi:hypothetical protein
MNEVTRSKTLLPPNNVEECNGYEQDFALWIETQVQLLRAGNFEQLDLDNIIDEMESTGGSQRRELESRLEVLQIHLLKCQIQPERRSSSWLGTIAEQRVQILHLLKQSPSLKRLVDEYADESYESAVFRAAIDTGLPESSFPAKNPFSSDELLERRFLP